ncbi:MAG: diaminopimelate decarboxylase [Candidatus Wallbacteria bacterium]|nr:diaminopimelate decarboxylase [Candidatus Wallbacteria bacterium]
MTLMYPLQTKRGSITLGNLELLTLASKFETPLFVYDLSTVEANYDSLIKNITWPHLRILFAMKANWNLDILNCLKQKGAGIDAVSLGDILQARKAGFSSEQILFTVNNIADQEMEAALSQDVRFNVGSISRLQKFAERYPGRQICVRFNPNVEAGEHEYLKTAGNLSKFGILLEDAPQVLKIARRYKLKIIGLHEHTGSGIADTGSVLKSMKNLLSVAGDFPDLEFIDFGGGFKVPYIPDEKKIDYTSFGRKITGIFSGFCEKYGRKLDLYFEPGKFLTANCAVFLVEVNTIRCNRGRIIAGVNSGLPHLIRPSFYGAYHHIVNLSNPSGRLIAADIAGNICESGDFFAKQREIAEIREGDILAIQNAGAYCYSMSSLYNLRPLPAEVVIEKGMARLSTRRLSYQELIKRLTP